MKHTPHWIWEQFQDSASLSLPVCLFSICVKDGLILCLVCLCALSRSSWWRGSHVVAPVLSCYIRLTWSRLMFSWNLFCINVYLMLSSWYCFVALFSTHSTYGTSVCPGTGIPPLTLYRPGINILPERSDHNLYANNVTVSVCEDKMMLFLLSLTLYLLAGVREMEREKQSQEGLNGWMCAAMKTVFTNLINQYLLISGNIVAVITNKSM